MSHQFLPSLLHALIGIQLYHWNTIVSTSNASNDCLWQQICGVHYPDTLPNSEGRCYPQLMNIHDLCKFDDMSNSSTWKQLLQRRMTSPYVPFGSNKQLQRDMETAFRTDGILAFSNCCGTCFNAYEGDDPDGDGEYSPENLVNTKTDFRFRTDGGIYFFKLFLNGMNYIHNQHPRYPVFAASGGFASYKDYWYLAQHWEEECEIIHRWCAILGLSKDEYIIKKPEPGKGVEIDFHKRCVVLADPPDDFNPMELLIESMFGNVTPRESASIRGRG